MGSISWSQPFNYEVVGGKVIWSQEFMRLFFGSELSKFVNLLSLLKGCFICMEEDKRV